jgi:hypothetical protein|tara:strand:+ start:153 stop:419 length:267 start_codon:yes stop_codon:yes gene_type:complete
MSVKVYIDSVTKELVTIEGTKTKARPPYSEVERWMDSSTNKMTIRSIHDKEYIIQNLIFSEAQTSAGVAYASLQAMWDALTPYFNSTT